MLTEEQLVQELWPELGTIQDADGNTVPPTAEFRGWCGGLYVLLTTAVMQVPVTGKGVPNGGPFKGSGKDGTLNPLQQELMVARIMSSNPNVKRSTVADEVAAIAKYLESAARIQLPTVTGSCTAATGSPPTPGVLALGAAVGGTLTGLDGEAMSGEVQQAAGVESASGLPGIFVALCKYLMQNTVITFPPGTVTGVFPPPGQVPIPIQGGVASGGVLS